MNLKQIGSFVLFGAMLLIPARASAQQNILFFDAFLLDNGGQPAQNFNLFFQWTVTDGTVDLQGGNVPGAVDQTNGRFVELGGSINDPGVFATVPEFVFLPNTVYNLSFDYKSSDGNPNRARASIGSQVFEVATDSTALQSFSRYFRFSAPTTARLVFEDLGGADNNGIGIDNVILLQLAPTAAHVTAGGRVTTAAGRAIPKALITMTNQAGNVRLARTNSFGFYNFADVPAGETYVFTVTAKGHAFAQASQALNISAETGEINFVGESR